MAGPFSPAVPLQAWQAVRLPAARRFGTLLGGQSREAMTMQRVFCVLFAAGLAAGLGSAALGQEVDIQKAVYCETLAQQFGDSIKAAKADDATKTTATDLAKQGAQACNGHNYDGGMDQLRQALQQVGLKPVR
jgi:hypothetical protein